MKIKALFAIAAMSLTIASCSKFDGDDYTPQPISGLILFHASPTTEKLDVWVGDGKAPLEDFSFGKNSDYLNVYSGERTVSIRKKGMTDTLVTAKVKFEEQIGYSLFVVDQISSPKIVFLKDDLTRPETGKARIRFVNASSDPGSLNLNIEGKATDAATNIAFKKASEFVTIDAAEKVTFNVKNTEGAELVVKKQDVKIESGKIYTVWVKGLRAATDANKIDVVVSEHKLTP